MNDFFEKIREFERLGHDVIFNYQGLKDSYLKCYEEIYNFIANKRQLYSESKKFNWNGPQEEIVNEIQLRQIYTRVYHVIDKVSNHFYQQEIGSEKGLRNM